MKTKLNSLLITTAGLTLSAVSLQTAAFGQTRIVANVPFSFTTAAGVQQPGRYTISPVTQDAAVMALKNAKTRTTSVIGVGAPSDAEQHAKPRLVFTCGSESGCALTGVVVDEGRAWTYKAPRLKASETERVAVIYFESKQAE